MTTTTTTLFPNETIEYRESRERLLAAEIELIQARERVARMRRELPAGPEVTGEYTFMEGPADLDRDEPVTVVRLSDLFASSSDNLIMINYMYGPEDDAPCPMCTMWADGYNAVAPHVKQRTSFVLVAATRPGDLRGIARKRGWQNIRLLSSLGSTFNHDYQSEDRDGNQRPGVTVFRRDPEGTIRLHYFSEAMLGEKYQPPTGQDPRGIDLFSPVWNLFDLLPEGRGNWYPSLDNQPDWYDEATGPAPS